MNLKDLVPQLELCKLIPAGEFADSVAIWVFFPKSDKKFHLYLREEIDWSKTENYPAPTLQEILAALPPYGKNEQILACCVPDWADFDARVFGEHWRVGYTGDCSINDKNPATAALKLWCKLKGIEG